LWPAAALLVAVAAVVVLARPKHEPRVVATPTAAPSASPAGPPAAGTGLAVGLTEPNPNLIATAAVPSPWSAWRDAVAAIHPAFYRLVIDWAALQPSAASPPDLGAENGGCMRASPPCLGWGGVRAQLKALAERQRTGGWEGVVVLTGTPEWAAAPASGCERTQATPLSRPPRGDALGAYETLVRDVLAAAREEGARLTYWSAWNEPNHPAFISPQRAACDASSPSLAPSAYAVLVRALRSALAGRGQLILGETAGLLKPTPRTSSVQEFIAGLPGDVVCASTVWSQHAYIGGPDPVRPVAAALAARGCPKPFTIWITETGVGKAPSALSAATPTTADATGCEALHARLVHWYDDPQVTAAFQYTVREDDTFPTGLVSTDLASARPALKEWQAWGGTRTPSAPPPLAAC
jgi:hypothetical protein